jgi:hypothetical protein
MVQFVAVLALAVIVYYASLQSQGNQLTVGGFVSFFGAMALTTSHRTLPAQTPPRRPSR